MRKLLSFSVLGFEPCPWSVPTIARNGGRFYPKKALAAGMLRLPDWKNKVRQAAREAMRGIGLDVHTGPTRTHIDFITVTPPGSRHGQLWTVTVAWNPKANDGEGGFTKKNQKGKPQPDICNLFKGTEDAIEGVIYGNDAQNAIISSSRWYGPEPGVRVSVYAIEPGDFPGTGDLVPAEVKLVPKRKRVAGG